MGRPERISIIKEIQQLRGNKVISYVLGDRMTLETKIHAEVLPYLYNLLKKKKPEQVVDLFLYGIGGITTAAWGIANLLNEFSDHYNVLIPYKALSAATLICLGAKDIFMTELGQLSPVDPSVNSPFNPQVSGQQVNQGQLTLLPVPVEDCIAFLDLAKKEAGIKNDDDITKVFSHLVEKIHPLALGGVYRAREQIKMLSEKLLSINIKDQTVRNKIIDTLTKSLYSHDYIISRSEAKDLIGLPVKTDPKTVQCISKLFDQYMSDMELTVPFIPEIEKMKAEGLEGKTKVYYRAFVESEDLSYAFVTERKFEEFTVTRPGIPFPEKAIKQQNVFEGWREQK
jgi:hypothetical protein